MKRSTKTTEASKRKARVRVAPSERSRWSYFMQGTHPDNAPGVARVSAAFGAQHPAWLIAANPDRALSCESFRNLREFALGMTRAECASYLRVGEATVRAWETGKAKIPFAPFEALRLISESAAFRLSHEAWDGWFINRKTGELVSPDVGKLAVTPQEVNSLPQLYSQLYMHKSEAEKLRKALDEATAENTRLRTLFLTDGVTDDLRAMQEQLNALLGRIGTARVMDFSSISDAPTQRKVAAL